MTARFSLGIDLGTSNCAMALTDLDTDRTEIVPIPQILARQPAGREAHPALRAVPAASGGIPAGVVPAALGRRLEPGIVGQFARDHGALVPDRLVTSAKSWLSNPHIDPKQRTLPWQSDSAEEKLSPFDCSRRYLQHLKDAFLQTAQAQGRQWDLGDGQIVVTVPASFDEVGAKPDGRSGRGRRTGQRHVAGGTAGRLLRLDRAGRPAMARCGDAGRHHPGVRRRRRHRRLQSDRRDRCRRQPGAGAHQRRRTHPARRRQHGSGAGLHAAGQIGGRRQIAGCLAVPGAGACRVARAKITLFEDASLAEAPIAVPSRGSSLFAKTIATALDRASLSQVILDGFFAQTALDDLPREARRTGLQEFGLPYASDPVISKHLARFLTRSLQNVQASDKLGALVGARAGGHALMPTAVLFNGGVFKAAPIRARVLDLLASWNGGQAVRELEGFEPDLAVAQGAAIYGQHRATGKGMRIKAGASRSYYIGLEASMPAIPGFRPPVKALCVVPQGMQEGTELLIEGRTFGLVTGQAAEFRFFSSAVRSGDTPGQILPDAERELEETSLLEVELPALPDVPAGQVVPVRIEAVVTELGTLELWMKHTNSDRRWKIEFQVRTE